MVDLVGFTSLAESLPPEDVHELLDGYLAMARHVAACGAGLIEKVIGDAVVLVWTDWPASDAAARAVRAALQIVARVTTVERHRSTLSARAGVVSDDALADALRDSGLRVREAIVRAGRLQSVGQAGDVVVDDRTRELTAALLRYSPMPRRLTETGESGGIWRARPR